MRNLFACLLLLLPATASAQEVSDTDASSLAEYARALISAEDCKTPPCPLPPAHTDPQVPETKSAAEGVPPDHSALDIKTYDAPDAAHKPTIITLEGDQ